MKDWQKIGLMVLAINFAGAVMVVHSVERLLWAAVEPEVSEEELRTQVANITSEVLLSRTVANQVIDQAVAEIIAEVRAESRMHVLWQQCVGLGDPRAIECINEFNDYAYGPYKKVILKRVLEERQ